MSFRGPRIRATKSPYQYPYMQYPYQNVGTQMTWRSSPPYNARGGDVRSMGLAGTLEHPTLPIPGAPETIPVDSGYSGTDCGGNCGKPCCGGLGGYPGEKIVHGVGMVGNTVISAVTGKTIDPERAAVLTVGAAGLLAYLLLKKRRR